jgi:hypothetical protein
MFYAFDIFFLRWLLLGLLLVLLRNHINDSGVLPHNPNFFICGCALVCIDEWRKR